MIIKLHRFSSGKQSAKKAKIAIDRDSNTLHIARVINYLFIEFDCLNIKMIVLVERAPKQKQVARFA